MHTWFALNGILTPGPLKVPSFLRKNRVWARAGRIGCPSLVSAPRRHLRRSSAEGEATAFQLARRTSLEKKRRAASTTRTTSSRLTSRWVTRRMGLVAGMMMLCSRSAFEKFAA